MAPSDAGLGRLGLSMRRSGQPQAPLGVLSHDRHGYSFEYVHDVERLSDFRPILGFSHIDRTYRSSAMFPFLSQRVLTSKRPDYESHLQILDLTPPVDEWQLLARSGGTRKGDPYEVVSDVATDAHGVSRASFFVRGLRFSETDPETLQAELARLEPGSELLLEPDPVNPVNTHATLVRSPHGLALGWVPDLLLPLFPMAGLGRWRVTTRRVNGADAPWHLRLLVTMSTQSVLPLGLLDLPAWRPRSARPNSGTESALAAVAS